MTIDECTKDYGVQDMIITVNTGNSTSLSSLSGSNGTGTSFTYNYPYDQGIQPYNIPNPGLVAPSMGLTDFIGYSQTSTKQRDFADLIEELFSAQEKVDFLNDMGYQLNNPMKKKNKDGEYELVVGTIRDLFIQEITIKFKNLLLAKHTLKLKL